MHSSVFMVIQECFTEPDGSPPGPGPRPEHSNQSSRVLIRVPYKTRLEMGRVGGKGRVGGNLKVGWSNNKSNKIENYRMIFENIL